MIDPDVRRMPPPWMAALVGLLAVLFLVGSTAVLWVASSLIAGVDRASSFANTFLIQCIVFTAILGLGVQTRSAVGMGSSPPGEFLGLKPARWATVVPAIIAGAALTVPMSALDGLWQMVWKPGPGEIETMMAVHDPGSNLERVFIILALVAAAPIGEEMMFRGAIWSWVGAAAGKRPALIISSILFASAHVFLPRTIPLILPVGLILGWMVMRTGSVLPSMAAHAAFNGVPILASWSGIMVPGWNDPGAAAATMNPIVVVAGTALLLAAIAAITVLTKRFGAGSSSDPGAHGHDQGPGSG